jgi:hypothetical protein
MRAAYDGVFRVHAAAAGRLTLRAAAREPALEVLLSGVTLREVPATLHGLHIEELNGVPPDPGQRPVAARFRVRSADGGQSFAAASVQIHEHPALYGRSIALPRFRLRQRLLWTILLWLARFDWGRALIRRARGGRRG